MSEIHLDQTLIAELCRKNEVSRLSLFGSFGRGEPKPESDIDFLVEFSKPASLLQVIRLERELSMALKRSVDLLTEPSISPYIRDRIRDDLRVVYAA